MTFGRFAATAYGNTTCQTGTEPKKSQVNTVSKLCRDGKLPAVKLCGEWRIDTSEILRGFKHD